MKRKKVDIEKILATVGFVFITLALYVIATTPAAAAYEITIYDVYPLYFWFFIVLSVSCGVCILVHQAFAEVKSRWWIMGLFIIIFSNALFLSLPFFRGYALYGHGDTLFHVKLMKDILVTGHISEGNFYPVVHILGAALAAITGVSLGIVVNLLFIFFSLLYFISICLLARAVANYRGQALLIMAFAAPLIFSFYHVNVHPFILSFYIVPLLLYFYHKREHLTHSKIRNTIAVLLLAFLITFYHPVTTLFTIIIFLCFGLASTLYRWSVKWSVKAEASASALQGTEYKPLYRNYVGVSFIMFITFFTWYFSFAAIQGMFRTVYNWLVYQIGVPLVQSMLESLLAANLGFYKNMELFINRYGGIAIYLIIGAILAVVVLGKLLFKRERPEQIDVIYGVQFVVGLGIGVVMLFGVFPEYNPIRVARYPILMATVFSGLVLYALVSQRSKRQVGKWAHPLRRKILIPVMTLIIIGVVILSIFNVYNSPRVIRLNVQVTQMSLTGVQWFEKHHERTILTIGNWGGGIINRFIALMMDYDDVFEKVRLDPEPLSTHFGYDNGGSFAERVNFEDRYMVMFGWDKVGALSIPEKVREMAHQYTVEDYAKLRSDSTVALIYTNGGFEVWRVFGKND